MAEAIHFQTIPRFEDAKAICEYLAQRGVATTGEITEHFGTYTVTTPKHHCRTCSCQPWVRTYSNIEANSHMQQLVKKGIVSSIKLAGSSSNGYMLAVPNFDDFLLPPRGWKHEEGGPKRDRRKTS